MKRTLDTEAATWMQDIASKALHHRSDQDAPPTSSPPAVTLGSLPPSEIVRILCDQIHHVADFSDLLLEAVSVVVVQAHDPRLNIAQAFLWLQEKSLLTIEALLYNPAPGIRFRASDLVRNLLLAPSMSLPTLAEQEAIHLRRWVLQVEHPLVQLVRVLRTTGGAGGASPTSTVPAAEGVVGGPSPQQNIVPLSPNDDLDALAAAAAVDSEAAKELLKQEGKVGTQLDRVIQRITAKMVDSHRRRRSAHDDKPQSPKDNDSGGAVQLSTTKTGTEAGGEECFDPFDLIIADAAAASNATSSSVKSSKSSASKSSAKASPLHHHHVSEFEKTVAHMCATFADKVTKEDSHGMTLYAKFYSIFECILKAALVERAHKEGLATEEDRHTSSSGCSSPSWGRGDDDLMRKLPHSSVLEVEGIVCNDVLAILAETVAEYVAGRT